MPALSTFSDFQLLTRDVKLTGPRDIINEATLHNYLIGDMLTERDEGEIFRKSFAGGKSFTERIQAYDNNGFQAYLPNEELTPTATDTIRYLNIPWRFVVGNYAWNDNSVLLNEGDPIRYGDLKYEYESGAVTSIINGMESLMCAVPNSAEMEAAGGRYPYSFPCFIQEGGAGVTMGGRPIGFTTVEGADPTTETWWQNQTAGYTGANIETADSPTGVFAAFDKMLRVVKFDRLKINQAAKYWENDNLRKMRIYTNGNGRDIFMRLLRSKNNRLTVAGPQDAAYPDPRFDGYPIDWIEKLDTALLYGTSGQNSVASTFNTSGADGSTATAGSAKTGYPRFYFMNFKYLYVVFHAEKYFQQKLVEGGPRQPFSHVMYYDTYYNLACRSRRRQGIVYPNVV